MATCRLIDVHAGEGGFLSPPPGYLKGIRELCNEHGIVFIIDEVRAPACLFRPSRSCRLAQALPGARPGILNPKPQTLSPWRVPPGMTPPGCAGTHFCQILAS